MRAALGILPTVLALVAEGAWVAVVYALLQGASQEPIALGLLAFALAAAAGALAGREGPRRLGDRWPAAAVALVGVAGLVGWLAATSTWAALSSSDPGAALSTHPGGWLVGLAFMRGIAEERPRAGDVPAGSLLTIGVPVIVAAFLVGGAIADPGRAEFRAAALVDTVVFVAAGLIGLALARIRLLGGSAGFDWRRNPAWLGLLVALVVGILLVAVPAAFAVGPLVVLAIAVLPVPLFVAGLFAGVDRRGWRTLLVAIALAAAAVIVIRLFAGPGSTGGGGSGSAAPPTSPPGQAWMTVAAWTVVMVAIAIAIAFLAALWMRQALAHGDVDVAEERTIDYGTEAEERRARTPRFRRRPPLPPPRDAPEAYLAAVGALASHADLRRLAGETPAEHARRLRAAPRQATATGQVAGGQAAAGQVAAAQEGGRSSFGGALDLLAADYELARFGGHDLTRAEHRRGIARWERIRASLRARRPGAGARPSGGGGPPGAN